MQSAQNTIYLQPDCRDFRDHPWACCGFIVSVSLTTALLLCSGFCIYCVAGHRHFNTSGYCGFMWTADVMLKQTVLMFHKWKMFL